MVKVKSVINFTIVCILFLSLIVISSALNPPPIQWEREYGEHIWGGTWGQYIWQTVDGGFLIVGMSYPNSQLIKTDSQGTQLWVKDLKINGSSYNHVDDFCRISDGGFIILMNGEVLIKLNQSGEVIWEKPIRNEGYNEFSSVSPIESGGYVIAGLTGLDYLTANNISLIETDKTGTIVWEKIFPGTQGASYEVAGVVRIPGNNTIIAGNRIPSDGRHISLILTDQRGERIWEKEYGEGMVHDIQKTNDEGVILVASNTTGGRGWILILKIDNTGSLIWKKTMEGEARSIQPTDDGGYILAGSRNYLLKISKDGERIWDRTFTVPDIGGYAIQTSDGGYIFMGTKQEIQSSGMGDMAHVISNVYVVKLAPDLPINHSGNFTAPIPSVSIPPPLTTPNVHTTTAPGFIWSMVIAALLLLIVLRFKHKR